MNTGQCVLSITLQNEEKTAKFKLRSATLWIILLATVLSLSTVAHAAISAADEKCLTCHSMPVLSKTLGDGTKLSLHIQKEPWSESVHSMLGCKMCHRDVDPEAHPSMTSIASAGQYAVQQSAACQTCHSGQFEAYSGSIHAILANAGNEDAPACSGCHDVHAQKKIAVEKPIGGAPCKACHEGIFDAYAGSMHGKAHLDAGQIQAPICIDCHGAHDVTAAASGDAIKDACLGCHQDALAAHDEWLPNSVLHLDVVSCTACHSPLADRSIDLRLQDRETGELLVDPGGGTGFEEQVRAIDTEGDGLDPMELREVVRNAGGEGNSRGVTLKGRLEVSSGVQAHQLALKAEAVRDCSTCHQSGSPTYENVTVSVAGDDGRFISYEAEEETLTSAVSVDAVGGFYTVGGTRIKILDILVVLAIIAGLAIPITHMSVRRYFKNKN